MALHQFTSAVKTRQMLGIVISTSQEIIGSPVQNSQPKRGFSHMLADEVCLPSAACRLGCFRCFPLPHLVRGKVLRIRAETEHLLLGRDATYSQESMLQKLSSQQAAEAMEHSWGCKVQHDPRDRVRVCFCLCR